MTVQSMNKLITKDDVEKIMNAIKNIGDDGKPLKPRNLSHYQTSFVHKSYLHEQDPNLEFIPTESNEVLEFLGDSFINSTVAKYLVDRFEDQQEGFLTKTRTNLVRSNMLHRFARFLNMGNWLLLSPQVERLTSYGPSKGRNNPRLYEDCFEAFCGAIIQDFAEDGNPIAGSKYVNRFVINIIEYTVDFADIILNNENFKDTLQPYFQSLKWTNPVYIDLMEGGPSHMRLFTKGVFLKKNYLRELSKDVIENVENYHNEQMRIQPDKVKTNVSEYCKENDSYLLGIASSNKKNSAEQSCSSLGLCNLKIHQNWVSGKKKENT